MEQPALYRKNYFNLDIIYRHFLTLELFYIDKFIILQEVERREEPGNKTLNTNPRTTCKRNKRIQR